jgi:ABC-type sulfate transport system permease subunit
MHKASPLIAGDGNRLIWTSQGSFNTCTKERDIGIFYYIPLILGGQIYLLIILAIYRFGALID